MASSATERGDGELVELLQSMICYTTEPLIQWNLSVTTTSMIKFITCDLFSNAF